ncbi:uncharacterized protein NP_2854A [Natronomonas pharaonis DSM 2160]|uniref:Uncharacterized protein n=1 Tax=Natronomonas pharaonis (strain ATCC 35678 / DSM 2160 / CIP 103997 / JCM 8858 / NBRC 14720 / NCIMB 2260 / Gabara) TaxID=348780 RepID=A0A1U7EWN8_NATPD|nr:hypothetical protein [Natronomonas pharaonis]CAI49518.1 uncharacterized protein NP_2854A [Natronomonas pharaonis DSM 2160]
MDDAVKIALVAAVGVIAAIIVAVPVVSDEPFHLGLYLNPTLLAWLLFGWGGVVFLYFSRLDAP